MEKEVFNRKIRKLNLTKKEKDSRIYGLNAELRRIKNDLLNVEDNKYKSKSFYHKWIENTKKHIIPDKKFKKDSLYYDLQCSPQDYFPQMVFMMKEVEKEGYAIHNVFPLRKEIIPKHIKLDTTTLVHLLFTDKQGNKGEYLTKGNLKRRENEIWKFFFRTERKCFHKKHYTFHNMIVTDGVSCSILLVRNDLIGKKVRVSSIPKKEQYVDELKGYSKLKNKKIVAIDPNLSDLIYCVDGDNRERNFYRYTQNQRRKETKNKKYKNIILGYKKEKIDGKSVIEWETEVSLFNRKSLDINEYKKYLMKKNEVNDKLFAFYEKYIFRKLKLNGYINRLKSEQRLINRFIKIFGKPKDTIITIGDFEQRKHRKFKEPLKGKGFRTLFRKNGFQVFLVDEFRTSCKCSNCEGGSCEKFRKVKNPKPSHSPLYNSVLSHGVLICKKCSALWNRDENSARNIYKIAYNVINKLERPYYMSRSNKNFSGATSVSQSGCLLEKSNKSAQPQFTRPEMVKPCLI